MLTKTIQNQVVTIVPDDVSAVLTFTDHKNITRTQIVLTLVAQIKYELSTGIVYTERTYIDALLELLREQAMKNEPLKINNRFWEAIKADVRATVGYIKNVGK